MKNSLYTNKNYSDRRVPFPKHTQIHMINLIDDKIKTMDQDELQQHLSITSDSVEEMRELLATKQRTHTLVIWPDHATLLGRGYILLTMHTLYDDMVFK